jgi:Coenzyme PQQ synthesis protein D (PqqD)
MDGSIAVDGRLVGRKARVPDHVVFRQFAQETVVLNLESGCYHSLNPTGGRMLEVLAEAGSIRQAAAQLKAELPEAADVIERDLCTFCLALSSRRLLQIDD